jgi:hypothetical protein
MAFHLASSGVRGGVYGKGYGMPMLDILEVARWRCLGGIECCTRWVEISVELAVVN